MGRLSATSRCRSCARSEGLWRIWTEVGATQQYYPLLHSAFWLEHRLWGDALARLSPGRTLPALGGRRSARAHPAAARGARALFAGLIFALHPVCVESVAWISEQKNTLSAVFYLASAYVYLRLTTGLTPRVPPERARHSDARLSGCLLAGLRAVRLRAPHQDRHRDSACRFASGVWWQRGRLEWRRDVLPLVPWLVVAALAGAFTIWFEHEIIGARGDDVRADTRRTLLLAGRVIWFYLGKLFWPDNLIFIYPRWTIDASISWQYLFLSRAVALAIALAVVARPIPPRTLRRSLRWAGVARSRDICFSAARSSPCSGSSTSFRSSFPMSPIIFSIWRASASSCPLPARWDVASTASGRVADAC